MHDRRTALVEEVLDRVEVRGCGVANNPRQNVCVSGDPTPSNSAYAPAHSIHVAPLSGRNRARASTNARFVFPSHDSNRRERAMSERG